MAESDVHVDMVSVVKRGDERAEPLLALDRRPTVDAAGALGLMLVLLSLVPDRLVLPGMAELGRPGLVVGLLTLSWWLLTRLSPELARPVGPQPIRWAFLAMFAALLVSYAAGFTRVTTELERNAADRALLLWCIFAGAALVAADGITSWQRLRWLLRVLVFCATAVAVIALLQYTLHTDVTRYLVVPGLQSRADGVGFMARGSGFRVASTTRHYIELASFLALAFPFGIHFAHFGHCRRDRRLAIVACVLMAGGVAVAISRTGVLGIALVIVVLFPVWTWRQRVNLLGAMTTLVVAAAMVSPGLVRTLIRIFTQASADSSVTVRQARYPMVFQYFLQNPWFGRGTGTWTPPQYQVLDNQWLLTMLNNGVIGVVALAALHVTGIMLAWSALRRSNSHELRHLSACLIATQVVGLTVAGTFDSLSFKTYAVVLMLMVGICGTVWRLTLTASARDRDARS